MTCPTCRKMIMHIGYLLTKDEEFTAFALEMKKTAANYTYMNRVYLHLLYMLPGNTIDIAATVKPENLERFIKLVCLFMYERPDYNVQFSNDYLQVIRKQGIPAKKEKETTEKTDNLKNKQL